MDRYALVIFQKGGREYTYLADDNIVCGNVVLVPVGADGEQKSAYVKDIKYLEDDALPCAKNRIKKVLSVISKHDEKFEFVSSFDEVIFSDGDFIE